MARLAWLGGTRAIENKTASRGREHGTWLFESDARFLRQF